MVRRVGGLWPSVIQFENFYQAYKNAKRGKSNRIAVSQFSLNFEQSLFDLQREFVNGSYYPSEYQQFYIRDKKPRLISAAAFRDRVAQHALMAVLEPEIDKRLVSQCFACRKGKGVHRAVASYQQGARRYPYVFKLDIKAYFHSIRHDCLKAQLARIFKELPVLTVLSRIIDSSPNAQRQVGIPIGNLTSQIFANVYLSEIDRWLQSKPAVGHYVRYVDDLYLLGDSKSELWLVKEELEQRLAALGLCLHSKKQQLLCTGRMVDIFGYRVSRTKRLLQDRNGHLAARRIRVLAHAYAFGSITQLQLKQAIAAWVGHACHADTVALRRQVVSSVIFQKKS